jgi:hypothetical protein
VVPVVAALLDDHVNVIDYDSHDDPLMRYGKRLSHLS